MLANGPAERVTPGRRARGVDGGVGAGIRS